VVAEYYPAIGGHKIATVVQPVCRRGTERVQRKYFGRYEFGVKTKGYSVSTQCSRQYPRGIHRFVAIECNDGQRGGAESGHKYPHARTQEIWNH
jgi:hypothetical protein